MAQPLSFLIELFDKMSGPAKAAAGGLDGLGGSLDKTGKKIRDHESGWTRLAHQIEVGRAAFEVVRGAAEGALGILEKIGENQATQGIFEDLLGKNEGKDFLDWLGKIRTSTAFTRDQLEGLSQPLAEFFKGDQLRNVLVAGLDVGRGSIERTAAVLDAFNKVAATGKISSKAFKTLGLVDPGTFKKLGPGDAGEASMTVERLLQLIADKSGGQLGGRSLQASDTVAARVNQLKNWQGELWEKLSDSPALPKITAAIGKLTEALTSDKVINGLADVLDKMAGGLPDFLDRISKFVNETDWTSVANGLVKIIEALGNLGGTGINVVRTVGLFGAQENKTEDEQLKQAGWGWLKRKVFYTWEERDAALARVRGQGVGEQYTAGMQAGMDAGKKAISTAGEACGQAAAAGASVALQIQSPSKVMERLGRYTAEGFAVGIEGGAGRVEGALASTLSADVASSKGGAGRGGSLSLSFGDINVQGGQQASAGELGDVFADRVRTIARDLIEDYGLEAGVA